MFDKRNHVFWLIKPPTKLSFLAGIKVFFAMINFLLSKLSPRPVQILFRHSKVYSLILNSSILNYNFVFYLSNSRKLFRFFSLPHFKSVEPKNENKNSQKKLLMKGISRINPHLYFFEYKNNYFLCHRNYSVIKA